MAWSPEYGGIEIISLKEIGQSKPETTLRLLPRIDPEAFSVINRHARLNPRISFDRIKLDLLKKMPIILFMEKSGLLVKAPEDEDGYRATKTFNPIANVDLMLPGYYHQSILGEKPDCLYEGKTFRAHVAVATTNIQLITRILLTERDLSPADRMKLVDYWVTAETVSGDF